MNTLTSQQDFARSAPGGIVHAISSGDITRLLRFIVEPTDDGERIRTLAIAARTESPFPLVLIDEHDDDQHAMAYAMRVFAAMKNAGLATSNDVALWRRGLFALVPTLPPA